MWEQDEIFDENDNMGFDEDELDFLEEESYQDIQEYYDTHNEADEFYWLNIYGDKYIIEQQNYQKDKSKPDLGLAQLN